MRYRFPILFAVVVVVLFAVELTRPVQAALVQPWTEGLAKISVAIIKVFDPNAIAYGRVLQSTSNGFAVSIEAGCNGVEAALILIAAIIAFRAPMKQKLVGIAGGLLAVQILNV